LCYISNLEEFMAVFLSKSEASKYLLGYEDIPYINLLLQKGLIGLRPLPYKNTSKKIYKGDLDKFISQLPLVKG